MRHLLGQLLRAGPGATDKTLGPATGLDIMVRLLNEVLIFGGSSVRIPFSISKAQPKCGQGCQGDNLQNSSNLCGTDVKSS